ncbi:hypothetical protein EV368DRAFT_79321 [Lentinula lateritia]|uniref:Uncharacterized protein n=1 Tax=Lentinula aff. lateritia TaxID=2804960 RepID=A0ACC1U5R6_9AGAR|nr:hypothetical protein F5876DRAFT_74995 [Lentinula aff. lateritia]KAJ3855769.1 hypothetical protein EV368DRAFT_79321 [Lentinula lateritia]
MLFNLSFVFARLLSTYLTLVPLLVISVITSPIGPSPSLTPDVPPAPSTPSPPYILSARMDSELTKLNVHPDLLTENPGAMIEDINIWVHVHDARLLIGSTSLGLNDRIKRIREDGVQAPATGTTKNIGTVFFANADVRDQILHIAEASGFKNPKGAIQLVRGRYIRAVVAKMVKLSDPDHATVVCDLENLDQTMMDHGLKKRPKK